MKLIDIFIKIANREEIPKFRFNDGRYIYFMKNDVLYQQESDNEPEAVEWNIYSNWLNREVEIIEEDKEIRPLPPYKYEDEVLKIDLARKIDKLIEAVNELKKGK